MLPHHRRRSGAFAGNARRIVPILRAAFLWQFVWWVALGAYKGRVDWHPALANYDSYGPLMVIGIGSAYFFGLATNHKKERMLAFATSIGCIIGLVSSFARGAFLGGVAVLVWIWFRSKRKAATALVVGCSLVVVGVTAMLFEGAARGDSGTNWFVEMSTIGSGDGTQTDREVLWALARRVWRDNPMIGVGAQNFGAYAAHYEAGTTGGGYDANPGVLWGRQLHSTYFQILCEYGTIGSMIFIWMLADFFWRNAQLRKAAFQERWAATSGGALKLHQLSLAVETAMIGFLVTAMFYNQIFDVHWLYTLLTVNSILHVAANPRRDLLQKSSRVRRA